MDCAMDEDIEIIRKQSDDHSASIASRLLQGWALLNEHCPSCYTPLVRNREQRMYCVACKHWVTREVQGEVKDLGDKKIKVETPAAAAVAGSCRVASSRDDSDDLERSPKRHSCDGGDRGVWGSQTSSLLLPKVDHQPQADDQVDVHSLSLPNTIRTLNQKIEELQLSISMTRDVSQLKQLLEVLNSCMQCLQLAKSIHNVRYL